MNKWQIAGYLIESKKCVDSLMFIYEYRDRIRNLDIEELTEGKIQRLYINLKVVYDKCLTKDEKKQLKENDKIYEETAYHRDKRYAHKDEDYNRKYYESAQEQINDLKEKVIHCYDICKKKLPTEITIDFIVYDKNLFRLIKNITPEKEEALKALLYNPVNYAQGEKQKEYEIFWNFEDVNSIKNEKEYAVLMNNGINLYEGLQNRQDACIKINLLYNKNIWCNANESIRVVEKEYEMLVDKILENIGG
ncbi:MAG: hypothetical protein IKE91_07470 [Clostridia bacterium]|nr:hypothetical protein [Clostridia bacterium]